MSTSIGGSTVVSIGTIDFMESMHSAPITISDRTRRELLKVAGELQQKRGEKVDYHDVIEYLLRRTGKSEKLLRAAASYWTLVGGMREALKQGRAEELRREDGIERRYA